PPAGRRWGRGWPLPLAPREERYGDVGGQGQDQSQRQAHGHPRGGLGTHTGPPVHHSPHTKYDSKTYIFDESAMRVCYGAGVEPELISLARRTPGFLPEPE